MNQFRLLTLLLLFPCLFLFSQPSTASPKRILLFYPAQGEEQMLVDELEMYLQSYAENPEVQLYRLEEGSMLDRMDWLAAFSLIISTDQVLHSQLSEGGKRNFEQFILGTEERAGGAYVRLGSSPLLLASRSEGPRNWPWYQSLIQESLFPKSTPAPTDWSGTPLPYLQLVIQEEPLLPSAAFAFACRQLPWANPLTPQPGKVIATDLGTTASEFSPAPTRGRVVPSAFILHLSIGLDWALGLSETMPLPIPQYDLQSMPTPAGIRLQWSTEMEVNHAYFSLARADGNQHLTPMENIPAVGLSDQLTTYFFLDHLLPREDFFYQLVMHNDEGEKVDCGMILIKNQQAGPIISFFPNPVQNELQLQVSLSASSQYELKVESQVGELLFSQSVNLQYQDQKKVLDLTTLEPGMYRLKIRSEDGETACSFVKH